ncbi:MAG: hypothetical protein ABSG01_03595 [Anaerolineales bacterium]
MKQVKSMTQAEVAAYVQNHLRNKGINVVLTGGATVAIYSSNKYVSKDIDMVIVSLENRKNIIEAMKEIGFSEIGRSFEYPGTKFIVEFPPGPLAVGEEPVREISEIEYDTGVLRVISPTECVKDRLVAYYHWGDQQCLSQALLVAKSNKIDMAEIKRWSAVEGMGGKFAIFRDMLLKKIKV